MKPETEAEIRKVELPVVYAGPATGVTPAGIVRHVRQTFVTLDTSKRPQIGELGQLITRQELHIVGTHVVPFYGNGGGLLFWLGFEGPDQHFAFRVHYREWPGFFVSLGETSQVTILPGGRGPEGPTAAVSLEGHEIEITLDVSGLGDDLARWRAAGG